MNPFTSAQLAMLFDQVAEPENVGNNTVASFYGETTASPDTVEIAWRRVVERHPILTSRIAADDSGFGYVTNPGLVDLDVRMVADTRRRPVREELSELVQRPFAIFEGPLVRFHVRCDGVRAVVVSVCHHVLVDVVSALFVVREFFGELWSLEHGEQRQSAAESAEFGEFVLAEQDYLASAEVGADRSYWKGALAGYDTDLVAAIAALPDADEPGDPLEQWVRIEVDATASGAIRSRAEDKGISPAAAFLAAYMRALGAIAAPDADTADIAVALPVLRRDTRFATTIGSFTQPAAVRVAVGADIEDDLVKVGLGVQNARRHGRLPTTEMIRYAANASNVLQTTFLYEPSYLGFGTAFVLGDRFELDMSGYRTQPYPLPSQVGQFPFRFQAGFVHGRYLGAVHFDPGAVTRGQARKLADLVVAELRDLARGHGDIRVVLPGEFGSGWRHPAGSLVVTYRADRSKALVRDTTTVLDRIAAVVRDRSRAPAVSSGTRTVTYAQLWAGAKAVAGRIDAEGHDPVCVLLPKGIDAVVAIVGVLASGRPFVVVDPGYPADRRSTMIAAGVSGIVANRATAQAIPETYDGPVWWIDDLDRTPAGAQVETGVSIGPEHPAYLVFTSGTTGVPKRVLVDHRALSHSTSVRGDVYAGPPERFLHLSSLSFDSAYAGLFWTLTTGGELVLMDMAAAPSTVEIVEAIEARGITHLLAIPSLYGSLLDDDEADLTTLRQVIVAGEECASAVREAHRRRLPMTSLTNEYGPSEAAVWSTYDHLDRSDGDISIGRAIPGIRTLVLDEAFEPVSAGDSGELYVAGNLAVGYLGHPRATAAAFVPDPWSRESGGRMYGTGDRVRVGEGGRLYFLGRVDDQLKIQGFRIEPREVEAAFHAATGAQCVVTARTDGPTGRRNLVALLDRRTVAAVDLDAAFGEIARLLPRYMVPTETVVVDEIPRGVNGKVDRRAVAGMAAESERSIRHRATDRGDRAADRTVEQGESVVLVAVERALDRPVDPHRSFIDQGGDSIAAMRAIGYLHRRGIRLSPKRLMSRASLDAVAADVESVDVRHITRSAGIDHGLPVPMTRGQRAMVLHTAADPHSGVYIEQLVLDLSGRVDRERLVRAWRSVFAAHPILGSVVDDTNEKLLRDKAASTPVVVDETTFVGADSSQWTRWLEEDRRRGFAIGAETLSRVVIADGPAGTRCVWTHHHAVADGWSLPVVITDLCAAYAGRDPRPPEFDLVAYARRRADAEGRRQPGAEGGTVRVLDRVVAPAGASRSDRQLSVELELDVAVDAVAARWHVTVGTLLNTAWSLTLAAALGTDRTQHGVISSGRDISEPGMDRAVGLFIGAHGLAVEWRRDASVAEVIGHVGQEVADAVAGATGSSQTPDTVVVVENYPLDPAALDFGEGVVLTHADLLEQTEFALVLQAREWPRKRLLLHVDSSRVGADAVATIARTFERVLRRLAEFDTDSRVGALLDTLAPPGFVTAPGDVRRAEDLLERVAGHTRRRPQAAAVVRDGTVVDYRTLDRRRLDLADRLITAGVRPGEVVAVEVTPECEPASALLGIRTAKATWIVLDDDLPTSRVSAMLGRSGARWSLAWSRDEWAVTEVADAAGPRAGARGRMGDAYLIFTSGTTGEPKCIAVGTDALDGHLDSICRRFDYTGDDVILVFGSLGFDAALEQLLGSLYAGATAVLRPRTALEPADVARTIGAHGVTVFNPPTGYWRQFGPSMRAYRQTALASLRTIVVGGEHLSARLADGWSNEPLRFWNAYGPTEGVITALSHRVSQRDGEVVPIGVPAGDRAAYVLGPDLRPVGPGVVGELWLGGSLLATGYLGDPRGTADAFRPDPFTDVPGARVYRTGDLAYRSADGVVTYVARVDRQLKVRGYRVDPAEIENAAMAVDGVVIARVLPVTLAEGGVPRLDCAVVIDGAERNGAAVRAALADRLPSHLVPAVVHVVDELPLTGNGKVDDEALRRRLSGGAAAGDADSGGAGSDSADIERVVVDAWRQAVGAADRSTGFLAAGGDSLRALTVSAAARRYGVVVDSRTLLADGTLEDLLAGAAVDPAAASKGVQPARSEHLPPAIHWFRRRVSGHGVPPRWNMAVRLEIEGLPASAELDCAIAAVLRVHPMLRTRLDTTGSAWSFVLTDHDPLVHYLDTRGEEVDHACAAVFNTLNRRVDMTRGQPIGFGVVRALDVARTAVVIVAHHFVMDIVSLQIVAGDLVETLTSIRAGRPARLEPEYTSVHEWVSWLASSVRQDDVFETTRAAYRGVDGHSSRDPGREASAASTAIELELAGVEAAAAALGASLEELVQIACASAYLRHRGGERTVLEVETHGRDLDIDGIDLTRTVGWFTGLLAIPIGTGSAPGQLAELRGRRRFLGRSGQRVEALRHFVGRDPAPGLSVDVGVNFFGRVARPGTAAVIRPYGTGRLRAGDARRPVEFAVDAWIDGDRLAVSIEHYDLGEAISYGEAFAVAIAGATKQARPVVRTGWCAVDLRGNDLSALVRTYGLLDAIAPLTSAQEAMYLRSQSDGDKGAYIEQAVLRIPAGADARRLAEAVRAAGQHYPLLRGSIEWGVLADPVLVVPAEGEVRAECVEGESERLAEREVRALIRSEGRQLFRALVVDGEQKYLLLTYHHLVVDGWTTQRLLRYIEQAYIGAIATGGEPDRRMLDHMVVSRSLSHARAADAGGAVDRQAAVLLPDLGGAPNGGPPENGAPEGNVDLTVFLDGEAGQRVRRTAAAHGVTFAALVHAAWAIVLAGNDAEGHGTRTVRFGTVGQRRPEGHADALGMYIVGRAVEVSLAPTSDIGGLLTAMHAALRDEPSATAGVTVSADGMYECAVIVDDARGASQVGTFLDEPIDVLSTRERTGLPLTVSVVDNAHGDGTVEITLNCDTHHVAIAAGTRILRRIEMVLEAIGDLNGTVATVLAAARNRFGHSAAGIPGSHEPTSTGER
ncbi:amino acid adenylation domain-containing protein [Nocardia sp. CDC159]|uniref:Amino acid adenylation domain-containing protein n=1 Tax=Nocardia pulmonis TaxID=2951408 RepID=A0A9X2EI29_9NOCA|nr:MULTISPECIES: non-ribosomal peptide synthetase [Nocardia]MCM6778426.1 amino acid adenylation domain-containing protein [Nocardia pulmonis]MCM6791315.1 amino acid adenylation domain-containing protein [Nocardia sp. CDC159]